MHPGPARSCVQVMPRGLDPRATAYALEAPVATEWLRVLRCANSSGWSLLSLPDHSAPVNTAFLVVKPSRALYLEGIAALQRAATGAFNRTHGWNLVGPPSTAVPALDASQDARYRMRGFSSEMRARDDWGFVCASLDQGFFFYMMRIRSALGSDLGRVCSLGPHEKPPEPRMRAKLRHYAGGVKPEESLALASRCSHDGALVMGAKPRSGFWRLIRPAAEYKLRGIAQEIARTLSWGERTRALGSELLGQPEATAPREFDRPIQPICSAASARPLRATGPPALCPLLQSCVAKISDGLRCLRAELDFYNVTLLPRRGLHSGGATNTSEVVRGARFFDRHFPAQLGGVSAAVPGAPHVLPSQT